MENSFQDLKARIEELELENQALKTRLVSSVDRFKLERAQHLAKLGEWEYAPDTETFTWSDETYRIFDIPIGSQIPTFYEQIKSLSHEEGSLFLESVSKAIEKGVSYDLIFKVNLGDNFIKYVHAIGEPVYEKGKIVKIWGTIQDISERIKAKNKIKEYQEQLQEYAAHLQTVRENERLILARELHDEMGQVLSALNMGLSSIIIELADEGYYFNLKELQIELESMRSMIHLTIQRVRKIITELRLEVLNEFGISEAITEYLEGFKIRSGIDCVFNANFNNIELDKDRAVAIFRIFQESLTNILIHSKATRVEISLTEVNKSLILSIKDNGIGFTEETPLTRKTFGLIGMRERATLCNGILNIKSSVGEGTEILLEMPLDKK